MARYRKRPVEVDAIRYEGNNSEGVFAWARSLGVEEDEDPMFYTPATGLVLRTLEGNMRADPGDWVIRGVMGEFYPCKPAVFDATYEPA